MAEGQKRWFKVPRTLATRARARQLRDEAEAKGCDVLDFSATEFLAGSAADELVCNGKWAATTGENAQVRRTVERVLTRRGRTPAPVQADADSSTASPGPKASSTDVTPAPHVPNDVEVEDG